MLCCAVDTMMGDDLPSCCGPLMPPNRGTAIAAQFLSLHRGHKVLELELEQGAILICIGAGGASESGYAFWRINAVHSGEVFVMEPAATNSISPSPRIALCCRVSRLNF